MTRVRSALDPRRQRISITFAPGPDMTYALQLCGRA